MKPFALALSLAVLLSACGKSEDSADSSDGGSDSSGTKAASGGQPWEDASKPYLDDKRMGNFIASLKDSNGPFDEISKGKISAFNAGAKMKDFDAAARRHGFESGEEYLGVWLRMMSAQTALMTEDMNQGMIKAQEEMIRNSQEALKKPDLTPEMKKMFEDQIKASQQSIEEMKKVKAEGVNPQDVATFRKHRGAFEEAMKAWDQKK